MKCFVGCVWNIISWILFRYRKWWLYLLIGCIIYWLFCYRNRVWFVRRLGLFGDILRVWLYSLLVVLGFFIVFYVKFVNLESSCVLYGVFWSVVLKVFFNLLVMFMVKKLERRWGGIVLNLWVVGLDLGVDYFMFLLSCKEFL